MKIGIIGFGFVGKALFNGLKDNVEVKIIDPKHGTNIEELHDFAPDLVFICVPTPMDNKNIQDISIVKSVFHKINALNLKNDPLIVLKSTVLPNFLKELMEINSRFVYNPEFLREKHANDDFINSNLIVFGGDKENTAYLSNIYKNHTKCICKDHVFTDLEAASLIKYTINSFLSLKVIFFNELKDVFEKSGSNEDWQNFIKYLALDSRIGSSHMSVPGHDGRKGYGGACLPKDSNALNIYANRNNTPLNLLKNAININNKIRTKYNTETNREKDQNIKFNGDDK